MIVYIYIYIDLISMTERAYSLLAYKHEKVHCLY